MDVEAAVRAAEVFVRKLFIYNFEASMRARNGVVLDLHAPPVASHSAWKTGRLKLDDLQIALRSTAKEKFLIVLDSEVSPLQRGRSLRHFEPERDHAD